MKTHGHEHEARWGERIVIRKQDASMIKATFKVCLLWTTDREMPLKDVRLSTSKTQGGGCIASISQFVDLFL